MMKDETKRWIEIAESDLDSSDYLYKGARYPQAVYLLCQAVEKLLKATQIEYTETVPRKTHSLKTIASMTGLPFSEAQYKILRSLTRHYQRVRYRDISQSDYNTKKKVEPTMNEGKELYLWIHDQLDDR